MHLIIFFILACFSAFLVESFQPCTSQTKISTNHLYIKSTKLRSFQTALYAKKKKRATRTSIGNRTKSASGFGGAATEPCPCGSKLGYMKCCGRLHKNEDEYAKASAKEVVLARYTAYAKREVSFGSSGSHIVYIFAILIVLFYRIFFYPTVTYVIINIILLNNFTCLCLCLYL